MTLCERRLILLDLIGQACGSGARLHKTCALIGLDARTVQRWRRPGHQPRRSSGRRQVAHHRATQQVQPGCATSGAGVGQQ